jgi:hypothetical protein
MNGPPIAAPLSVLVNSTAPTSLCAAANYRSFLSPVAMA